MINALVKIVHAETSATEAVSELRKMLAAIWLIEHSDFLLPAAKSLTTPRPAS
jgi:hypothetical protein